jgi:hypothetical protein
MVDRRLILIELNEINFDIVERYVTAYPSRFPAFRKLLAGPSVQTTSESKYELLEPWIQWVSVHTGLSYEQHGIFRLGDMADKDIPQLFEVLEGAGIAVGAISPMNAGNRLRRAAYFIPDPWTRTPSDRSWWSRALTSAVSQAVNDNSQARITPSSAVKLLLGLLRFARPRNYIRYLKLALGARRRPWRKALFLDLFLHDLHLRRANACKPGFSALFLNAGAHIQHHYFLNSRVVSNDVSLRNPAWYISPEEDPIADMLEVYDCIVGDYLDRSGSDVIIATGLSQRPYDRVKFYYRLREHAEFLRMIGIDFKEVVPRMTRDFLITFEDAGRALVAQELLAGLREKVGGQRIFGEIDNRGDSLFVTLTFPEEIREETEFEVGGRRIRLAPHVAFVAIKNGMHDGKGFAFFTGKAVNVVPSEAAHVKELHGSILRYFGLPPEAAKARRAD